MKPIVCLYHKDCIDGYAAAWVVGHACGFESVEFVAVSHGRDWPLMLMEGREVYIVDFLPNSPADLSSDALKDMAKAKRLVMLDHHESAYANWKDVPLLEHWTYRYEPDLSGVGVAWRWFFGAKKEMPTALQLIQDRDLWKFQLDLTREFHAVAIAEGLLHQEPSENDWLARMVDSGVSDERWYVRNDHIRIEGAAILKEQKNFLKTLLKRARLITVLGHEVPICNVPYDLRSEAGFWLSLKYPFSITYDDVWEEGVRKYSIRSNRKTGINVMPIAEAFGGGGHKHAAAFTTSVEEKNLFWIAPAHSFQFKLDLEIE
jgi:oligoribonuclease NrnB/cAMP/cGMP phosphodiesterase (DHH superfamily)